MAERPNYARSQIQALGGGDLLNDSDDDYASFHSDNSVDSANTVVRRYTPSISPRTRAQSEATILNILPSEGEPVAPELQYLRASQPFPAPEEEYALTIPQPAARRASYIFANNRMRDKPTSMSMEYYYGSPPTPQDDRPFVLYALDQITRDAVSREGSLGGGTTRVASYESTWSSVPSVVLRNPPIEEQIKEPLKLKTKFNPKESLASLALPDSGEALYIPVDHLDRTRTGQRLSRDPRSRRTRHSPLDFLPRTLRPWSRRLLTLTIILMAAAILFCAEYSRRHNGLLEHTSPFNGRYVLFHYLFPILAAALCLWIQGVIATLFRIAPFTTMTHRDVKKRADAKFMGQQLLGVISFLSFPILFTVPLASSIFTVQRYDSVWRYTTNLPIAYTLVAIYLLSLLSLLGVTLYFADRKLGTGLHWDPRSLADIIALLSRSNCLDDYRGTEVLGKEDMRGILGNRAERLGYWTTTKPTQDEFYGIGVEGGPARRYSLRDGYQFPSVRTTESYDTEKGIDFDSDGVRHAYLPWYLTRSAIILWPVLFFALYIALLVVSFHPSTTINRGFSPRIPSKPDTAGFSRSNFVFSFIPAILGMGLFVWMQKLYFTLCQQYPWVQLSKEGGETAKHSLLLDYSASGTVPFGATASAISNSHWVIAALSIKAPVSIVIPILAGGCFSTYTAIPSGRLLVFPHTSAFYTLIALLGVYLLTLIFIAISVLRMGTTVRMPKPIACLADITSFLYASGVLGDAAFLGVVSAVDLRTRLLMVRERGGGEVRYFFGGYLGKDGERQLGVERVGRVVDGEKLGLGKGEKRRSGRERKTKRDGSWMSP